MGILPEKYVQKELFIKKDFKKTDLWKEGVVFINDRVSNPRTEIVSLEDAKIKESYNYELKTGEIKEEIILDEESKTKISRKVERGKITYKLSDFGENVVRSALDKIEFYKFKTLKRYFPHIKSIKKFISSTDYLDSVEIEVLGPKDKINELTPLGKLKMVLFVVQKIAEQAKVNISEFKGSKLFKAKLLKKIFRDKIVKINKDKGVEETKEIDLNNKDWFAQTGFYGTSEEENFIKFIDEFITKLRQKYSDIALLRNEKFFQIFDFDEGRAFEPDFIMILKRRNKVINIYQIFIEPKGEFLIPYEKWKQDFLFEMEKQAKLQRDLIMEAKNEHFKLIGLPFYNEKLKKEFEEALENKILA